MKKIILSGMILFIAILSSYAQLNKIDFIEYDLKNGLHVILHQDNSSPVVAINIMYHTGSKNEKPDRTGFAHFFEHLMFEGSENISRGEYFKLVQNAGGKVNAFTSFDKTDYFEILPSNQLELGLWLESERLMHLKIDSVGVETQRKVVKEERKQSYENQPYGSFLQEIFKRAFNDHPYSWVPIGEAEYIDEAKLGEFMEFYNHYYVPNNAVLTIAGDIDIKKTKDLIKAYFGPIPKGTHEIYRPEPANPSQNKEIRDTIFDNIQLPAPIMAYHMPAQGTKDYYALEMLQNLLSGGESSRLYKSIVDNKQMALQIGSVPFALEDAGFVVYAISNFGVNPADLEEAMQVEIDKVKTEGLSDDEFQKLRNQTENSFVSSNSTMDGIALSLNDYYTFFGDANLINNEIDRYLAVTKDDIQNVANKYLVNEKRVILYYLPKQ